MVKSIRISASLWILLWTVAPLFPVHDCTSTSRPKNAASTAKTTTSPKTTATAKTKITTPATTTLSPEEVMRKIYSMHGSGGYHSHYRPTYTSSSSSGSKKKQQSSSSSATLSPEDIMEKLYQQHALGIVLPPSSSSSSSSSPTTKKPPQKSSSQTMDQIYQQHSSSGSSSSSSVSSSSSPSSVMDKIFQAHSAASPTMQHILYQHSVQKQPSRVTTKPPRTSPFSSVVEPLLKQLTPVGAGLGVILAPFLLLDGFFTFFGNIGNYLNNFAHKITAGRWRPGQSQGQAGNYRPFGNQPTGPAFLRRQPRFDFLHMPKEEVQEFLEMLIKAIDRYHE